RRGGETYLLALCEGNRCAGGAQGRKPGRGRIQIFRRGRRRWEHVGRIRLPETLLFADYSSISAADGWVAVVSQVSSALWVGRLSAESWEIAAPGMVYAFPRDPEGRIVYCT